MNLILRPVTTANRERILALQVQTQQAHLVETTAQCLDEADHLSLWHPLGLYDNDTLIGFAMYGFFPNEGTDGRHWLDRLLIDAHFQGQGYGRAALVMLMQHLTSERPHCPIYLSVYDHNAVAIHLYQSHGFTFNGELDFGGEKVMVYHQSSVCDTII